VLTERYAINTSDVGEAVTGERVEFASRGGGLLVGDLHRIGKASGPMLLLCHGMESTRQGTKQQAIVERFLPLGFSVFRFDFSFVGESDGRFEDMTVSAEVEDALGAIDFVQEFSPSALVVIGSSLGGTVALLAAAHTPERVHAIATIAAVADTALFCADLAPGEIEAWRREGRRRWRDGWMNVGFLNDVERIDILAAVSSLPQPLLVLHGEADPVVPLAHAIAIAAAAPGDVTLATFPGVGHRFEEPGALPELLDRIETWVARVVR
jgi:pimeloyl-ACP methyl ester carboxylesterase